MELLHDCCRSKRLPELSFVSCQSLLLLLLLLFDPADGERATIAPDGTVEISKEAKSKASNKVEEVPEYGVDVSWPMHHSHFSITDRPLGDAPRKEYENFLNGCQELSPYCHLNEQDRIEMNYLQPQAMQNYTSAGYAKMKAPTVVFDMLQKFWNSNHRDEQEMELWSSGSTYVNHWASPTYMVPLGNDNLPDTSQNVRKHVVKGVQNMLERWTKQYLQFTSLYGIRIYKEGSILAPHVDRLPLVTSAIINVAQDVDEPWILEVIGHDGKAANLTMEPGDIVLYESHTVIHGRPYPLKGNYYANIFLHFEPLGHTKRHMESGAYGSDVDTQDRAKAAFERALEYHQRYDPVGRGYDNNIAPSISPDKQSRWKQDFVYEKNDLIYPKPTKSALGLLSPHTCAADGDLSALKEIAQKDRHKLFLADDNGWRPLHEAARSGRHKVLKYLLEQGAQPNERTNNGNGGNALWWAEKHPTENKKAIEVLKEHGAVSLAPIPPSEQKKEK